MSSPNLEITVQPTDGTRLFYLPIAAKAKGESEYAKIVLRLRLKNLGNTDLTLKSIVFSYPNSDHGDSEMDGIKIAIDPAGEADPNDACCGLTRSQPLSLLSIARLKRTRFLTSPSSSSRVRIDQTSFIFRAGF